MEDAGLGEFELSHRGCTQALESKSTCMSVPYNHVLTCAHQHRVARLMQQEEEERNRRDVQVQSRLIGSCAWPVDGRVRSVRSVRRITGRKSDKVVTCQHAEKVRAVGDGDEADKAESKVGATILLTFDTCIPRYSLRSMPQHRLPSERAESGTVGCSTPDRRSDADGHNPNSGQLTKSPKTRTHPRVCALRLHNNEHYTLSHTLHRPSLRTRTIPVGFCAPSSLAKLILFRLIRDKHQYAHPQVPVPVTLQTEQSLFFDHQLHEIAYFAHTCYFLRLRYWCFDIETPS
jgi:hypothetical protein